VASESPRQEKDPLSPPRFFSPRWVVGTQLTGTSFGGALDAQRAYADDEWNRFGVVHYGYSGPTFLGLEAACGVAVPRYGVNELINGPLADFPTFPFYDLRRADLKSQTAVDFRNTYQNAATPVVAMFPVLGHYDQDGVIRDNPQTLGATPGVVDPYADGVIFLKYQTSYPMPLAHEMIHLLTGQKHDESSRSLVWSINTGGFGILNLFSETFDSGWVWNGRYGSEAGVDYQAWRSSLLTLVSVDYSSNYNQCTDARGSLWLLP
jgi:hypothetical protein